MSKNKLGDKHEVVTTPDVAEVTKLFKEEVEELKKLREGVKQWTKRNVQEKLAQLKKSRLKIMSKELSNVRRTFGHGISMQVTA